MNTQNNTDKALRFDGEKNRLDLVSPNATNELAKILTFGSQKYAAWNWAKGMKWSRVIGSLKRHLNAIERGEDFDPESGLLHSAHVMCNAMFLTEYYKIYPQGDDRHHTYLNIPKIALDIDGVLADFIGHITSIYDFNGHIPTHWNDPIIRDLYPKIKDDKDFWLSMPPLIKQEDMPFEPHCYITSRSIDVTITEQWLDKHGFPRAPVYSIGHDESKINIAKNVGVEIYVDDRWENFVELNNAGICCFLFDAPYNRKHDIGYRRIYDLKQLIT